MNRPGRLELWALALLVTAAASCRSHTPDAPQIIQPGAPGRTAASSTRTPPPTSRKSRHAGRREVHAGDDRPPRAGDRDDRAGCDAHAPATTCRKLALRIEVSQTDEIKMMQRLARGARPGGCRTRTRITCTARTLMPGMLTRGGDGAPRATQGRGVRSALPRRHDQAPRGRADDGEGAVRPARAPARSRTSSPSPPTSTPISGWKSIAWRDARWSKELRNEARRDPRLRRLSALSLRRRRASRQGAAGAPAVATIRASASRPGLRDAGRPRGTWSWSRRCRSRRASSIRSSPAGDADAAPERERPRRAARGGRNRASRADAGAPPAPSRRRAARAALELRQLRPRVQRRRTCSSATSTASTPTTSRTRRSRSCSPRSSARAARATCRSTATCCSCRSSRRAAASTAARRASSDAVSAERFRGVRIFDITDISKPKQVAAVQTCRGSHTHTLVTDPKDKANLYVYGSGTEHASGRARSSPAARATIRRTIPNTALFSIDVIQVPLAAPEKARDRQPPAHLRRSRRPARSPGCEQGGDHGPARRRRA